MKKFFVILLVLLLCTGCQPQQTGPSQKDPEPTGPIHLKRLHLELITEDADPEALLQLLELLPPALKKDLQNNAVEVDSVELSFSTSSAGSLEAVQNGIVDLALVDTSTYLSNESGMHLNVALGSSVNSTGTALHAMFCTTTTEAGMVLRDKGLNNQSISWADLAAVRWGAVELQNSLGSRYAQLWLQHTYHKQLSDLPRLTWYPDTDALLRAVAAGELDMVTFLYDERTNFSPAWNLPADQTVGGIRGFNATEAIHISMKLLFKSDLYYPYVIAIRDEAEEMNTAFFRKALSLAMERVLTECKDLLPEYARNPLLPLQAEDLAAQREYSQLYD